MENVSEGTRSNKNRIGLSASTFGLPRYSHWICSGKKKPPISYYTTIILNYRNVAKHLWREPQIITFENSFHIWINIGYICECTLSALFISFILFFYFPSSVPQVQNKCIKNIQNENTKYICDIFPFVIFEREILTDVYRAEVTFFNSNRRDGLYFL